ncbi:transmembrane alpha-helix domain-containing protein [Colletotrichum incanum]|uniref:Transmembrane alpha-helix domain-containing protein n=1 Tax=Colletotrichum incanum TaxID=1573173 RepID=A0A161XXI2_COLIC|nr:transmembrane alpha-helix domain-containing protein [Colletotrichum incanum]
MAELDPNAWYRLSETRVDNSTGPFTLNLILRDVGLRVHTIADGTAAWQFQPFGDVKGRYLMRLDQAGVKQQLGVCYDAKEPAVGATVACLQESSVDDSQIWEISTWNGKPEEYKFVNVANGTSYVLDVHPKANLFMNKDVEGLAGVTETQPAQHWVISSVSPVNDGAYSTIYSGNVAVSTNSATLSTASTTSGATTTPRPTTMTASQMGATTSTGGASTSTAAAISTSGGISPGAGAGIGVGVAIGVVGLIGAIAFFWWRRQQAATTHYSEVEAKNRGSPGAGSSSLAGSPATGSYALPYGVQRADSSYPGYSGGSPATMSYPAPVRGGGSPATMSYPVPVTASSPSESRSLRSWPQHASASGLAVPAAGPRHQFDHPDIHNEFAPAASSPSFESISRFGFSTNASSQANSTTNLNDPDPLPSAHELEVAVRDVPRRQHELGDFHHGPETFDISRETQPVPAPAPAPQAELGAFQHGPDTFAQSHEAKMLGTPTAELGAYHHGPDTFEDGHEDKMLGGFPSGAEKYQREREDKVLGSFHDLMDMAPSGRRGRQPGPSDGTAWQTYEMQSIRPR